MIGEVVKRLPDDISILILPTQAIGKSNEHIRSPGTITLTAETALRTWVEVGEAVNRAGLKKLVMINSHGGNVEVIGIVARELRVRFGMLVVASAWRRFGLPPDIFSDQEAAIGIHGGDIETSLMLYFRPDLVRMDKVANFAATTINIAKEFAQLGPRVTWLRVDRPGPPCFGRCWRRLRRQRREGPTAAEFQAQSSSSSCAM